MQADIFFRKEASIHPQTEVDVSFDDDGSGRIKLSNSQGILEETVVVHFANCGIVNATGLEKMKRLRDEIDAAIKAQEVDSAEFEVKS